MPQRPKHTMLVSQFELEFNSCFRWPIFTIGNFNRCSLVRNFVSCANPFSADVIFSFYRIFDLDSMRKGCAIPVSYTHLDVYKRQSLGRPALGLTRIGRLVALRSCCTKETIGCGPRPQLRPIAVSYTHLSIGDGSSVCGGLHQK